MTDANEDLVRRGYQAFSEGDMETLSSLYAPDAVHVATGNSPVSGEYRGVDAILAYYGTLFELSDGTFWSGSANVVVTLAACLEDA